MRCIPQEDHSEENGKGGGDIRQRERWRDEGTRKKDMWRRIRKRREGKKIARGAGRKEITRKGSGGKGAESLPKRSLDDKKEKARERGKKRHVREEEKEDGVLGEWEDGFFSL